MDYPELTGRSVSPELVLVDPELAAKARAALPDRPRFPARAPAAAPPATPAPARKHPFSGVVVAAGFIAGVIVALTLLPTPNRPTLAAGPEASRPAAAPSTAAPLTRRAAPRSRAAPPTRRAAPRSKAVPPTRRAAPRSRAVPPTRRAAPRSRAAPSTRGAAAPSRAARPTRRPPAPSRAAPPTRAPTVVRLRPGPSFAWRAHPDAVHYNVRFLRNGRAFYETWTPAPRVRIPGQIRFRPGRYRWIVRPAVVAGQGRPVRLAAPIVDSTFTVKRD